ncbi:MAG: fibronectin type III domain-containing protein, partial [Verrucomicrobia bacterium]|nr:fibronectin type III domain-containing protein [Verrucomicrobiota bacterium]
MKSIAQLLSIAAIIIPILSSRSWAAGAELFLSPNGNDANPGTRQLPVKTLQRARDLVRNMNRHRTADITIVLEAGTYRLSQPLNLDTGDSGAGGHNVIYTAAPGQHVIISGGVRVTGWKLVDAKRNLWSARAPAALANTRQLYINGLRACRTMGRLPVTLTKTRTGYIASSAVMAGWKNPGDIEFVYTGGNGIWSEHSEGLGPWTEPRCPIAAIEDTTITMAEPCWDNSTKRVMLPPDSRFRRPANLVGPSSIGKQPEYVENAYELLGTPGQFYFDRQTRVIYYTPRPEENLQKADVEAPVLEKLIDGQGDDAPIHDIIFKGLQFSYATWLFPSSGQGFSEIQANYMVTGPRGYATQGLGDLVPNGKKPFGDWTKTPGNVSFQYDQNIQFLDDDFVHLGGAGLDLGDGSQSDVVQGCVFTDISANGLELGGVDVPQTAPGQQTRNNRILDNHIYNVAAEYHGGIGIDVGYAAGTLIAHNQLDHLPYTAISIGWGGWPDKIHRPGIANFSQNNRVQDNLIFDYMLLLADGGGIYTQGKTGPSLAHGEKLSGNVIHGQFGSGHGIYTDNGCDNVTADGNVLFHINFDNWGGRHRDYYDGNGTADDYFDFENNYWQQGDQDSSAKNVTLKNNRMISALDQVPAAILDNAGLQPAFRNILKKRFGPPAAPQPPSRVAAFAGNGFALVTWNPSIFDGGSPVRSYIIAPSTGGQIKVSSSDYRSQGYAKIPSANGTPVSFTVWARNANGISSPSLPSATVTPSARTIHLPEAPLRALALPGDGMASVHVAAPARDGGSPVTAFVVTAHPGGRKTIFEGRKFLVLAGRHVTFDVV